MVLAKRPNGGYFCDVPDEEVEIVESGRLEGRSEALRIVGLALRISDMVDGCIGGAWVSWVRGSRWLSELGKGREMVRRWITVWMIAGCL